MRVRIGKGFWSSRFGLTLLGIFLFLFLSGAAVFTYYYVKYARMIDERLSGQVFANTSRVFTGPRRIAAGQAATPAELASYLQRAGYTDAEVNGAPGRYRLFASALEVRPSAGSYFGAGPALRIEFSSGAVDRIVNLRDGGTLESAELEPELLTNLFDVSREKRRPVRFDDLPKHLVDAVLSAEDKRFFEHPGFDPIRILGAAWANVRRSDRTEGASTISMQVARSYFFTTERTWKRKAAETLVALQLEQRFTKQQIFELYANQVYLGNRGSFAIRGFGEAARAYFGKDVRDLSLSEAAFLAGIARAPNRYSSAERHLERANEARDRVLAQMVENGQASVEAAVAAKKAPWHILSGTLETSAAPYFVDMVKDHLLEKITEADLVSQSYRIYTTLDTDLQRAAAEAMDAGLREIDKQLARRYERWRMEQKKTGEPAPLAQVALVALDPRTGEIKALIGGRNYGLSQLNRALARRQPGSAFKPFVYAAAFGNAIDGLDPVITPVTTVVDEPTTFHFDDKEYTPNNYGEQFYGTVTLRDALKRSLNVATVKVAEMVGYARVVEMARQLGLDPKIQATPAVALGAYEMTPLDVAAGYTVFANGGERAEPMFLRSVVSAEGIALERAAPRTRPALDPRIAYLVTNLLEEVVNHGTAAGVRARGFTAPAAGKTGTSHDGWFAGFTSNLLCVVWVGFDDNRELGLAGSASAAPIWAEFMKRATALPGYRNTQEFEPPPGVITALIDPETLQLATPACPAPREEVFIEGTEPKDFCPRHGGRSLAQSAGGDSWLARIFGGKKQPPAEPAPGAGAPAAENSPAPGSAEAKPGAPSAAARPASKPRSASRPPAKGAADSSSQQTAPPQEQKSIWRRLFGIFGGGKKDTPKGPPTGEPAKEKKDKAAPRPAKREPGAGEGKLP
ncbi:MAG: PBP1A family penicillin-binding protein [Acidobacteria bacterium]|nr:PBP1A family penicillin-binding protein [Acidobacteriota bacterium]MBI3662433.1 PBP1A family penicillin-binding protein [Acidobacteriota bacterium]